MSQLHVVRWANVTISQVTTQVILCSEVVSAYDMGF